MNSGEPPWLATWVLTRCTSDYQRDSFIGDLIEQYAERGGGWYWRQALGAVRAQTIRAVSTAAETRVPAAEFIGDLVLCVAMSLCALIQLSVFAHLLISLTPLIASGPRVIAVSAMIGFALVVAATATHEIRLRAARAVA